MKKIFILFLIFSQFLNSQILTEKERAHLKDEILSDRFNNLLPLLMDQVGIDMWVIISREYNEDPVMRTMLPATWLNARRRTILVFYRNKVKNSIEKMAIARYDVGKHINSSWNKEEQSDQWKALVDIIIKRNPNKIGINTSKYFALADGLVKTDYDEFIGALSGDLKSKVVSAEKLAIAWIETRTDKEMELYKNLVQITHDIIDEAFSNKVIQSGKTTTDDVVWWMRQKVTDLGLDTWFHPTIDIQRSDEVLKSHIYSFTKGEKDKLILPGDLLHCDFGITYLGLNTDCQQHAYIPLVGEIKVPEFLNVAFKMGNDLQDIFTANFIVGETGNKILKKSLDEAKSKGLRPAIYTHPLGNYGHSAGTTFGMWDSQEGVLVNGDYPLHINTVYAIELNTTVFIKPWNKDIRIMLEEDGIYSEQGLKYINKRQTAIKFVN